jgi:hypothetical protein
VRRFDRAPIYASGISTTLRYGTAFALSISAGGVFWNKEIHMNEQPRTNDPAANPDPITKAPGSHPIGTGVGAAAGGAAGVGGAIAAGAAAGSAVGPVGTAVGAAIGAVAGGLIGKGVAEGINPTVEHEYWRNNFSNRPYYSAGTTYDDYAPAYQYGWESQSRYPGEDFDNVESRLGSEWDRVKGKSRLEWERAKNATRDAWDRVSNRDRA